MKHIFAALVLLAACDGTPPVTPRNGSGTTGDLSTTGDDPPVLCPVAWPRVATPTETSQCSCDPQSPECPAGTDCVLLTADQNGEYYRCLAPIDAKHVTLCTAFGQPRAPVAPVNSDTLYCSACAACSDLPPKTLVCKEETP